jgi:hypothetical protein
MSGAVRSEDSDDYHAVVAHLSAGWRVIVCKAGIQWILQRRGSPKKPPADDWRGRSYCRTSEALIRCAREHAGEIDPAAWTVLAAFPERIDDPHPPHLLEEGVTQ